MYISPEVHAALEVAARDFGVPIEALYSIAAQESAYRPSAQANTSSAGGLFQFIDDTWESITAKYGGKYGINANTSKYDPVANARMGAALMAENIAALKSANLPVTTGSLYTMHFAGPRTGIKALKAAPNTPASSIFSNAAVKANRSILSGKTIGQVMGFFDNKMDRFAENVPPQMAMPSFAQTSTIWTPAIDGTMLQTPGAVLDGNKLIGTPQFRDEVLAAQNPPVTASMPWDGLVDREPNLGISMAGDEYIGSPNFGAPTAAEPQKDASIPGEFSGYNPSPYPAMDMTTVPDELAMSQYAGTFGMQRGIPSIADELETGFNPTYGLDPTPQAPQQSTQVAPGLFSNFDAQTGLPNPGVFGAPTPQAGSIGFGISTNDMPGIGASAGAKTGLDLSSLSGPASPNPTITAPQNDIDPVDIPGSASPGFGAPLGANVGALDFDPYVAPAPQTTPTAPQPDVTNISVDQHGNITYGQPQQQSQPGGLFGGLLGGFANQNNGFFGPSGLFGDPAGGFLGQGFGYFGGGGGTGPTGGGFNGWGGGWSPASWGGGFGWSQHGDPAQSDGYYD